MADKSYLQWLHSQPCAVQPCVAAVQAHHSTNAPAEHHGKSLGGRRGKSQRPDDAHAFALCLRHHGQFHDASGPFRDWTREQRRAWQDEQVRIYRDRYEETLGPSDEFLDAQAGAPSRACQLGISQAPAVPPLAANDPRAVAREFCREHALGDQIAFDLERLLRRYERTVF